MSTRKEKLRRKVQAKRRAALALPITLKEIHDFDCKLVPVTYGNGTCWLYPSTVKDSFYTTMRHKGQGTILAEQTRIMNEQFAFSRKVTTQAERSKFFDDLLAASLALDTLIQTLESTAPRTPDRSVLERTRARELTMATKPCQKAVLTSMYISDEERDYFKGYINDLITARTPNNFVGELATLKSVRSKYPDFMHRVLQFGQTEI